MPPAGEPETRPFPAPPRRPAESAPEPDPESAESALPRLSAGARLLATQMAISGSGRDEIKARLEREFGVKYPTALLREIGI